MNNISNLINNYQHWVFDMDGTLTLAVHDFDYIRQQLNIAPQADILTHLDNLPQQEAQSAHAWLMQHEYELAVRAKPAPGAEQLLSFLHKQNYQLAILTRNAHSLVEVTLKAIGMDKFFAAQNIYGREQAQPKPSPDGMLKIADAWQICPSQLVMVGDFHFDLTSAKQAGAGSILIHEQGNLWPELCDLHAHSCHQLLQLLQNQHHQPQAE